MSDDDGVRFANVTMDEASLRSMIEAATAAGLDTSGLVIARVGTEGRVVVSGVVPAEPDGAPADGS